MARIGIEWVEKFHQDDPICKHPDLRYSGHAAESFLAAMRSFGHDDIFNWGNDNAWSSDFDHPDFGGNSLNRIDNVHFCCFAGHGGQSKFDGKPVQNLAFSSRHAPPDLAPCFTMSAQWRLGVKWLKWFLLDSCVMVKNTDPNHVVEVWGNPMQGVHLLFGFIGIQRVSPNTHNRRVWFADDICRGRSLANAWLDTAFHWENPNEPVTSPIAIAAGASRDEAIHRREHETLGWLYYNVASTNWLAWKWRD
jgi:Family of unknown function (DUF6345)